MSQSSKLEWCIALECWTKGTDAKNIFQSFTPVLNYFAEKLSAQRRGLLYKKVYLSRQNYLILLDHDPVYTGSRMSEKIKSWLCSSAVISMQPSDNEPACIWKRSRFRNMQSDSPSLLSMNVVCCHVPHWKHPLNEHSEEWRQIYCTPSATSHKKIERPLKLLENSGFWNLCFLPQDMCKCVSDEAASSSLPRHCANRSLTHNRRLTGRLSESFAPGSVWKTNVPVWAWCRHSHAECTTPAHNLKEGT